MTTKVKDSYKGIPAHARAAVKERMEARAMLASIYAKNPQGIYREMVAQAKMNAEGERLKQKEQAARWKAQTEERARASFEPAIRKLATIRDLLHAMANDEPIANLEPMDAAMLAHAALIEFGEELEQSLIDLSLIPGTPYKGGKVEGFFKDRLK